MNKLPAETPFTNNAKHNVHIGGIVIKPGHSRMVPTRLHPDYFKLAKAIPAQAAEDAQLKRLTELLKLKAPEVLAAIEEKPETFTDADLEKLQELERGAKQPRKGLLSGIEETLLERAREHDGAGILGMLAGENVAAGIEASDILTPEDLQILEKGENEGQKRQDVLLAIEAKMFAITQAHYAEILAKPDAAKVILDSKDLGLEDLRSLESQEYKRENPREDVVAAIEQRLKDTKESGGGIFARVFGKK